jgi:cephalosporin hydroxylase
VTNPITWILAIFAVGALGLGGYFLWAIRRHSEDPGARAQVQQNLLIGTVVLLAAFALYEAWQIHVLGTPESIIERFHILFYYKDDTWRTTNWLGIETLQNPPDVWMHQEIICEVKPDFIVETGTYKGGSALLWAMVLAQIHPPGQVITVDLYDHGLDEARKFPIWKDHVQFIAGSSIDPKVVADITRRVQGKKVLVILDSVHRKDHVLAELAAYSPLVSPGSYIIVQDTSLGGHPVLREAGLGAWEAVDEFLRTSDRFVSDRSRERLLFTMHPRGYLKRTR